MKKWIAGIVAAAVIIGVGIYAYQAQQSNVVRIGYQPSDHHAALFVALAKHMFQKEGIKVETYEFKAGPPETQALAAGKIDVAYIGCVPAITAYCKGVPIKIVAGVNQGGSAIVVRKDEADKIKSIKDLKGKKIAELMKGSIQDCIIRIALRKYGINPDKDVDLIEMSTFNAVQALGAKQIDAFIEPEPGPSLAVYKDYGVRLMDTKDILPNHQCCVLVMTKSFIRNHPDLAKKILKIHIEATKWINEHPKEAAEITAKKLHEPVKVEEIAMKHVVFSYNLNVSSMKIFANFLLKIGYIHHLPNWSDFVDLKLLR